jgi:DNA-binding MarR family transcriptional regulator
MLDLEKFRFPIPRTSLRRKNRKIGTRRLGRFIKGPLPLNWLIRAGQLPGKSLHVGLVLWYQAGLTKSTEVRCPMSMLTKQMAVSRHSVYRALVALEKAALITVERHPGSCPVCRLSLEPKPTNGFDSERPESAGNPRIL